MRLLLRITLNTLAVVVAARILPGVHVDGLLTALIVAVVLGVINAVVKPVLVFLTLPATILTLGLFLLVINAAMVELVSWLVPGFTVAGFWWALGFSLIVSLVGSVLGGLV